MIGEKTIRTLFLSNMGAENDCVSDIYKFRVVHGCRSIWVQVTVEKYMVST